MTPLTATKTTGESHSNYSDIDSFDALYHELAKGIQSAKNGEVYTIDEAWEEINQI